MYYVDKSHIHGKGLFAARRIKKGEVIGIIEGRPSKKDGPHVLWFDDGTKGFRVTCELRFINHTKTPNVGYFDDHTVVALRNIKKGEELTHDYGDDWD